MYIDYEKYYKFENYFTTLHGQYLSPGGVAKIYGVKPQAVTHWISRDNVIDAHRFSGSQGTFVIVPIEELSKIDRYRNKENFR